MAFNVILPDASFQSKSNMAAIRLVFAACIPSWNALPAHYCECLLSFCVFCDGCVKEECHNKSATSATAT